MFQAGNRLDIVCSLEADAFLPYEEQMNVQYAKDCHLNYDESLS